MAIVSLLLLFYVAERAQAATGINEQINFQGKVVNTDGTNVTTASYTFLFCIYTTASPATACTSGANNDAIWRESKSITVTDGIFQTNLGDTTTLPGSVDFNTDNIYLGINFNANGQMTPLVRFTAAPYALNAAKVSGLTVTDTTGTLTVPNGKTISFADAFATSGAFATTLTSTGVTNATLPSGTITLVDLATSQSLTNKTIGSTGLTFSGATTDITTASGEDLTITAAGAGIISLSDATTIVGSTNINTTGTAATAIGNATGTFALTSSGGLNVTTGGALTGVASIDTIATSATGLTFAGAGTIASTTTSALTLDSGTTGTVNLGIGNNAKTIAIGTGTAGNAITIGTNNTTSDTITIGSALDNVAITGDQWSVTDAGVLTVVSCTGCGGGGATLDSAYTAGNTIGTDSGSNVIINLADVATPTEVTINNLDPAGTNALQIDNSTTLTNGLLIEQSAAGTLSNAIQIAGTAGTITSGLLIADGAGTITNGIQLSGTFTTTLLDTPSIDISAAGAISGATGVSTTTVTASSTIDAQGDISDSLSNLTLNDAVDISGALAVSGTSLTATSATTITLGSTGADTIILGNGGADTITIGNAASTGVSIIDNNWSVAAAGAATFTGVTSSGAIAANGGITFDAGSDTIGAFTAGGTILMGTNIIENIGNTGTDFIATTGALTLAGVLTANGGVTLAGSQAFSASALSYMDLGAITHSTTANQGLRLPNAASATPSNPTSGEGYLAWDAAGNQLIAYNGSAWATVGGGTVADDSLDYTKFLDSMTLDANLILAQTTFTLGQTFTGDTTKGLTYTANSLTTGNALSVEHTTAVIASGGSLLNLSSTSADTASTSGSLLNLAGNTTAAGTLARISGTSLTTGMGMTIIGGSAMTTGSDLDVNGATYVHGANSEVGSLAKFTFSDTTSGAFTGTTNGILVSPTVNITAGAATKTINGISVTPTFTACTTATCNVYGLNIGTVTDSGNFASTGLQVGTGWDTIMSGTTAGTSIFDFTNFDVTTAGNLDTGGTVTAGSSNTQVTDSTGHVQHDSIVDCADGEILKWATGGGEWGCASDSTGSGPTTKYLNSQHNISSTTATEVTGISTTLTAGTYVFKYSLIVQAAATGTGISFGINYTGTVTKMVALEYFQDSLTAASGGTVDDANTGLASEQIVAGSAARTETTTAPNMNVIQGFTTANTDTYVTIEGVMVVSDGGDIELWHASESAAQTSVMTGSTLTITQITQGADFAEIYGTKDASIVSGDVVALDPTLRAGVKKSMKPYDENIFGIVATSPGVVTGSLVDTEAMPVIVALSGRVPVKVTTENGPIKPGDLLTSSSVPGVAMRATKAGQIIGQAMRAYDSEGIGSILVFIKTDYGNGIRLADLLPGLSQAEGTPTLDNAAVALLQFVTYKNQLETALDMSEIMTDRLAAGLEIITPKVLTQELAADSIRPSLSDTLAIELGPYGTVTFGESGKDPMSRIDALGNATFAGMVTAKVIRADTIEGLEIYTDSVKSLEEKYASLAAGGLIGSAALPPTSVVSSMADPTVLATQSLEEFRIENLSALDTDILGQLTVAGALTLGGTAEFHGETLFQQLATFFSDTLFKGRVVFEKVPTFSADTAGFAIIAEGQKSVDVIFDEQYLKQPIISVTLTSDQNPLFPEADKDLQQDIQALEDDFSSRYFASDIKHIVTKKHKRGFTILLSKAAPHEMQFSWIALMVDNVKTSHSVESAESSATDDEFFEETVLIEEPASIEGEAVSVITSTDDPLVDTPPDVEAMLPIADTSDQSTNEPGQ